VDAVGECMRIAQRRVHDTWEKLDPLLEDSLPKLMMRTFSTLVCVLFLGFLYLWACWLTF
jgi:hypothetical protein